MLLCKVEGLRIFRIHHHQLLKIKLTIENQVTFLYSVEQIEIKKIEIDKE